VPSAARETQGLTQHGFWREKGPQSFLTGAQGDVACHTRNRIGKLQQLTPLSLSRDEGAGPQLSPSRLRLERPSAKRPVSAAFPRGVSGAAAASAGVAGCRLERGLVGAHSRSQTFSVAAEIQCAHGGRRESLASGAHQTAILKLARRVWAELAIKSDCVRRRLDAVRDQWLALFIRSGRGRPASAATMAPIVIGTPEPNRAYLAT
jgi:hypothetical protein